jgi:hypothetical protein
MDSGPAPYGASLMTKKWIASLSLAMTKTLVRELATR